MVSAFILPKLLGALKTFIKSPDCCVIPHSTLRQSVINPLLILAPLLMDTSPRILFEVTFILSKSTSLLKLSPSFNYINYFFLRFNYSLFIRLRLIKSTYR